MSACSRPQDEQRKAEWIELGEVSEAQYAKVMAETPDAFDLRCYNAKEARYRFQEAPDPRVAKWSEIEQADCLNVKSRR